jgi:microcystin-dependent protein
MSNPFIGEIRLVGFNFAPVGWALCQGQLMAIAQNEPLFQLIGTTYGGDGQTTFALPDLRGRLAIDQGQGSGLQNYTLGGFAGTETATVSSAQLPVHTHTLNTTQLTASVKCKNGPGNSRSPVGNVPAIEAAGVTMTYSASAPDSSMKTSGVSPVTGATASTGGGQAHENMQPYLVLNYCISLQGIFPSQ